MRYVKMLSKMNTICLLLGGGLGELFHSEWVTRVAGVHRFAHPVFLTGSSKAAFPTKTLFFHSANI